MLPLAQLMSTDRSTSEHRAMQLQRLTAEFTIFALQQNSCLESNNEPCCHFIRSGACPYPLCRFLHDPTPTSAENVGVGMEHGPFKPHRDSSSVSSSSPTVSSHPRVTSVSRKTHFSITKKGDEDPETISGDKHVVDNLYYSRASELHYGTPLGFSVKDAERDGVFKNICSGNHQEQLSLGPCSRRIRMEIALFMRGEYKEGGMNQFTFWPTHILYEAETCMVIQQKAFCIEGNKASVVVEITTAEYQTALLQEKTNEWGSNKMVFLVHELAFGPAFKQGVTPPGLYFQLEQEDLVACHPEIAKKYVDSLRGCPAGSFSPTCIVNERFQAFMRDRRLLRPPFRHLRPVDRDAFHLVTRSMQHQLQLLKVEEEEPDEKCMGHGGKHALGVMMDMTNQGEFHKQKDFWNDWLCLPRTLDHKVPNHIHEAAPSNYCSYVIHKGDPIDAVVVGEGKPFKKIASVWDSFIENSNLIKIGDSECNVKHRLPFFRELSRRGIASEVCHV